MSKKVKRLFPDFSPSHYDLEIKLDPKKLTFSGHVTIAGQRNGRPSERFTLHQNGLKITKASVTKLGKKGHTAVKVSRINNQNSFDEVRLHCEDAQYQGSYSIYLEFSGKITRNMNGLYPCYFNHAGQKKMLLATQFESHHAREVFPCIDEPEAKATFTLSLVHPKDGTIISNTPIDSQTKSAPGTIRTIFNKTPIMSTYLLAFVYGELEALVATTKDGVVVRTYATPDNVTHTQFALDTAVKLLDFYNDYFAIPYPLEKCDMIALPDFASGAMENWGCVTYREQALLVDDKNSTLFNKQWVAMVIAHELAHQWFGNLVTMRWWTDLWLNEGFASWIEFLAVDHIFPDWNMWTQFTVNDQQQALKLDALANTHPVEVTVNHPDEIRSIFDAISYSKGASVIHMLNTYLGDDVFRDGLRHYLNRHAYSNTDTIDLWQALEEVSGKPVKRFMSAWTSKPGFPLLSVSVKDSSVAIEQERFFLNPIHDAQDLTIWPVPLLQKNLPDELEAPRSTYTVTDTHNFLLNDGQSGFYRVAYNSSHLIHLGEIIRQGKMSPEDRLGLLSDVFETAKSGHSDTSDALHFLENFRSESDYAVWDVIASALSNIRLVMGTEEVRSLMRHYTRQLVAGELERLGWDKRASDSHFDRLLRPIILGQAAVSEIPEIVSHCRKLFDRIETAEDLQPDLRESSSHTDVKRGIDIDPDMRGVVFGTIARKGDAEDFKRMVHLHNTSKLSEERNTLCAAITGFKDPKLIARSLDMIISDDVRLQDVGYWLAYGFLNRHAKKQTWQWLKDNWSWLKDNLGTDLSFYRTPIYAARVHSEESFIDDYKKFFEPRLTPAMDRSYRQGLEILELQSAWKKRDQKSVKTFFEAYKNNNP